MFSVAAQLKASEVGLSNPFGISEHPKAWIMLENHFIYIYIYIFTFKKSPQLLQLFRKLLQRCLAMKFQKDETSSDIAFFLFFKYAFT